MAKLVISIGLGKGTWQQAVGLIENAEWEQILVVCDKRSSERFNCSKEFKKIIINPEMLLTQLEKDIQTKLRPYISMGDVGLNMISGIGKEHMAILSALLKLGAGIRLVEWDGQEVIDC